MFRATAIPWNTNISWGIAGSSHMKFVTFQQMCKMNEMTLSEPQARSFLSQIQIQNTLFVLGMKQGTEVH